MQGANIADPRTWNGYAYVSNDPLSNTDPDGLGIFGDIGSIVGTIFPGIGTLLGWGIGSIADLATGQSISPPGVLGAGFNIVGTIAGGVNNGQPWNEQWSIGGGGSLNTGSVFGSGSTGGFIFSFADQNGGGADIDPSVLQIPGLIFRAQATAKAPRPKWLNNITSVFGYDQNVPLPSCFGIAMKSTWNHLNPFSPDVSGTGEAVGTFYALSKYNQAIRYAASTPSRTFGTQFLMYPYKSSVFRNLLKASGRGALAGGLFSLDISLAEGLYDEIQAMKQGACQ